MWSKVRVGRIFETCYWMSCHSNGTSMCPRLPTSVLTIYHGSSFQSIQPHDAQLQQVAALWPAGIRGGSIKDALERQTHRKHNHSKQHVLYHISQIHQYRVDQSPRTSSRSTRPTRMKGTLSLGDIRLINSWCHCRPYAKVWASVRFGREDWLNGFSTQKTALSCCWCATTVPHGKQWVSIHRYTNLYSPVAFKKSNILGKFADKSWIQLIGGIFSMFSA